MKKSYKDMIRHRTYHYGEYQIENELRLVSSHFYNSRYENEDFFKRLFNTEINLDNIIEIESTSENSFQKVTLRCKYKNTHTNIKEYLIRIFRHTRMMNTYEYLNEIHDDKSNINKSKNKKDRICDVFGYYDIEIFFGHNYIEFYKQYETDVELIKKYNDIKNKDRKNNLNSN
jgi:hypothetical protein